MGLKMKDLVNRVNTSTPENYILAVAKLVTMKPRVKPDDLKATAMALYSRFCSPRGRRDDVIEPVNVWLDGLRPATVAAWQRVLDENPDVGAWDPREVYNETGWAHDVIAARAAVDASRVVMERLMYGKVNTY